MPQESKVRSERDLIGMPYDDYEWREMYWSEIEEEIQKL